VNSNLPRIFLLLIALASGHESRAYVDPPTFSPAKPTSAHTVVMTFQTGYCHAFADEGYQPPEIAVNGGFIDVTILGEALSDIHCIYPPVIESSYTLGRFSAGSYSVRLFRRSLSPPSYSVDPFPYFVAPLVISQAPPKSISTIEWRTELLLILAITVIALFTFKAGALSSLSVMTLVGIMLLCPGRATASDAVLQRISVLLSGVSGAPSAQAVVEHDYGGGAIPPLSGLAVENPSGAAFLMLPRAQGEFASYLRAKPDLPRAKLERYVVITYPTGSNLDNALAALIADPFVIYAHISSLAPQNDALAAKAKEPSWSGAKAQLSQDWRQHIALQEAWNLAGGWSLVGVLDQGIQTSHPDLVAFDGTNNLTGGNVLGDYALDIGHAGIPGAVPEPNVDELQSEPLNNWSPLCDPDQDGSMTAKYAGHGTHVTGLVGANAYDGNAVAGVCRNCGVSLMRITYLVCFLPNAIPAHSRNATATSSGIALQTDLGIQVISMSFGSPENQVDTPDCSSETNDDFCLAVAYATSRGVVVAAASGNRKEQLYFPATQPSIVAVGGTGDSLEAWDEDPIGPDFLDTCPFPGTNSECGTNWTVIANGPRQEVALPARKVLSTIYTGKNYNNEIECGDSYGTPLGDGIGTCTGTSMSTPIYAGIVGLVRSVNPLVGAGDPDEWVSALGVRDVVAYSGVLPGKNQGWTQKLGYGRPQADSAVAAMLGKSNGMQIKNRLTPLFALYSATASDWAYVATPQSAVGLIHYSAAAYQPQGPLVRGYSQFPGAEADVAPRANALVFTTEYKTSATHPDLTPLYWMSRKRDWPLGCSGAGCNVVNADHLLATSALDVKTLRTDGFAYRGLQGYVYKSCAPEPACIPSGAQKLYRQCKSADDDCAVFLENERAAMESQGFTAAYPIGSTTSLGYAYPNTHSDKDHLPDAVEQLLGTNPIVTDSDRDGICDHLEYPPAGVPLSDPCGNGKCASTVIFGSGYESDGCS
jgi:serine protease